MHNMHTLEYVLLLASRASSINIIHTVYCTSRSMHNIMHAYELVCMYII